MYQNGFLNLLQAQMANSVNGNGMLTDQQQQLLAAMAQAAVTQKQNNFVNPNMYNNFYPMKNVLPQQNVTNFPSLTSSGVKNEIPKNNNNIEEKVEEKPDPSSSWDERTKARLARNRTTARLRRERKKHQAENLTKQVAELTFKLETLEAHLETLPKKAKKNILKGLEDFGPAPVACIFCDFDFPSEELRARHVESSHAAEVKARSQAKAIAAKDEAEVNSVNNSKLSPVERRKRRLERNAASARLCRQRKKLYIENLRQQLPSLRHRVDSLRKLIPDADSVLEQKLAQSVKVEVTSSGTVAKASPMVGNGVKPSEKNPPTDSKSVKPVKNETEHKVPTSPVQSGSVSLGPSGNIQVNIPRLSGWDSSSRRNNVSAGYESGGSTGSSKSNKSRGRDVSKESNQAVAKRRRGSTSVDISSGSPSPISTMTSFNLSPTPFSLSAPAISASGKTNPLCFMTAFKPQQQKQSQDQDVFNAAVALSTLVPFTSPAAN